MSPSQPKAPTAVEQMAENALLKLVARWAMIVASSCLLPGAIWFGSAVLHLQQQAAVIEARLEQAQINDRRRIGDLEQAAQRATEALALRAAEIERLNGFLREVNATLRGIDQRIDLLRLDRRGDYGHGAQPG